MQSSARRHSVNYQTFSTVNNKNILSNKTGFKHQHIMPKLKVPAVVVTADAELGSSSEDFITGAVNSKAAKERDTWGSKVHFLLTLVAYAVGLGNLWRFPYLCQEFGGGAFLIPYFIMLFVEGIPLFVLELGIGQKMRMGSIGVWNKIHPMMGGVGIASAMVSFLVGIYYIVLITWCLYYVLSSFASELPWSHCPAESVAADVGETTGASFAAANFTPVRECAESSASAYFWYRGTLNISDSIEDFGGINLGLLACFTIAWAFMYFNVHRGIKSSGNVIYFTSLFPYCVLTIFFIRAVTLKGAWKGLHHMLTPKMHVLLNPIVWLRAATQIFFSLGLSFGSLISFGSYNQRDANVRRDSVAVACINCCTSVFAAVVIFSILGYKANHKYEECVDQFYASGNLAAEQSGPRGFNFVNVGALNDANFTDARLAAYETIRSENYIYDGVNLSSRFAFEKCDVERYLNETASGPGFAFIVFAEAITKMPFAPFWAIIFFAMLLTLGVGSMVGNLEGVITPIHDLKPFPWMKRWVIAAIVCVISYFVGIVFVTRAGQYWLRIFDDYAGTFSLTTIALCETIAIAWIYGVDNFIYDIQDMCGVKLGWYWKIMWKYVGPLLMGTLLVWSLADLIRDGFSYKRYVLQYAKLLDNQPFPTWVVVFIILLIFIGILPIPLVALLRRFGVSRFELSLLEVNTMFNASTSTQQIMGSLEGSGAGLAGSDEEMELDTAAARAEYNGKARNSLGGKLNAGGFSYKFGQADRLREDSELSQQLP